MTILLAKLDIIKLSFIYFLIFYKNSQFIE